MLRTVLQCDSISVYLIVCTPGKPVGTHTLIVSSDSLGEKRVQRVVHSKVYILK